MALNQWLYHNMDTVASMYEDRFDLCTLESRPIDPPCNSQTENQGWLKRFTQRKSNTMSSKLNYLMISSFSMAVKRTKELRALTGWYFFFHSYFLSSMKQRCKGLMNIQFLVAFSICDILVF